VTTNKTLQLAALLLLALPLGGCNGAFVGNFFVLFVSMGIFFGTLNLNRVTGAPRMPAKDRSATESSS
jgi:hypothetical protein